VPSKIKREEKKEKGSVSQAAEVKVVMICENGART